MIYLVEIFYAKNPFAAIKDQMFYHYQDAQDFVTEQIERESDELFLMTGKSIEPKINFSENGLSVEYESFLCPMKITITEKDI